MLTSKEGLRMFRFRCLVFQRNIGYMTRTSVHADEDKDKSHIEVNVLGLSEGRCSAHFHYVWLTKDSVSTGKERYALKNLHIPSFTD